MKSFIIFVCIQFIFLSAFAEERWLTQISSNYTDQVTGKVVKLEGSGFIVACIGCVEKDKPQIKLIRFFVFTAAHVSQGKDLEIVLPKTKAKLTVIGSLTDNLHDVEIFEVTAEGLSPNEALAIYLNPQKEIFSSFRWNQGDARLVLTGEARNYFSFAYKKSARRFLNPDVFFVDQAREPFLENSFVPVAPWINGNLVEPPHSENSRYNLAHVPFGNESLAKSRIANGMSGAPLIRAYDLGVDSTMVIDGIVSRKLRGFDQTYFISNEQMDKIFKSYLNGQRGYLDKVKWHMAEGITYRSLDDGTREIVNVHLPTGNGLSGDGGDGAATLDRLTSEPMGMVWKGQQIAGFSLNCELNGRSYNFSIYANLAVIDFFKKFHTICRADPISSHALDRNKLTDAGLDAHLPLTPLLRVGDEIVDIHEIFFVDLSMFAISIDEANRWNEEKILEKLVERSKHPRVRRQKN